MSQERRKIASSRNITKYNRYVRLGWFVGGMVGVEGVVEKKKGVVGRNACETSEKERS